MVRVHKLDTSVNISKAPSVEQAFIGNFLSKFKNDLSSSRKINDIDLSHRELLGLIVASVFINICYKEPYTVGQENFFGLDGVIMRQNIDSQKRGSRTGLFFEQVYVFPGESVTFLSRLQKSLKGKILKGQQYSQNINLIILTEENISPSVLQEAIKNLHYEMILHINALPPQPFHFDLNILKNNDLTGDTKTLKIYLDKLTGIQQALVNNKRYLVINGQAIRTKYNLPLEWKLNI